MIHTVSRQSPPVRDSQHSPFWSQRSGKIKLYTKNTIFPPPTSLSKRSSSSTRHCRQRLNEQHEWKMLRRHESVVFTLAFPFSYFQQSLILQSMRGSWKCFVFAVQSFSHHFPFLLFDHVFVVKYYMIIHIQGSLANIEFLCDSISWILEPSATWAGSYSVFPCGKEMVCCLWTSVSNAFFAFENCLFVS